MPKGAKGLEVVCHIETNTVNLLQMLAFLITLIALLFGLIYYVKYKSLQRSRRSDVAVAARDEFVPRDVSEPSRECEPCAIVYVSAAVGGANRKFHLTPKCQHLSQVTHAIREVHICRTCESKAQSAKSD